MIGLGRSSDSWAERLAAKTTLYKVFNILISHSFTLCYECVRKSRPSYWFEFEIVLAQVLIDNPGNARKLKFVNTYHSVFSALSGNWHSCGACLLSGGPVCLPEGLLFGSCYNCQLRQCVSLESYSNLILQDSFGFYSYYFVSHTQ